MSKHYKHVLIQKVTFSTKKELFTQPCTRKPCINTQKLNVDTNQTMWYLHTNSLECTQRFLSPHSVSRLQQPSLDFLIDLVYS